MQDGPNHGYVTYLSPQADCEVSEGRPALFSPYPAPRTLPGIPHFEPMIHGGTKYSKQDFYLEGVYGLVPELVFIQ